MNADRDYHELAYVIVLLGLGLAAAAAVMPFFGAGYKLHGAVLLSLLSPFFLYATFSQNIRGLALPAAGLALLALNGGLVLWERFLRYDGYADGLIYWLPLVSGLVVLFIAYLASTRKSHGEDNPDELGAQL